LACIAYEMLAGRGPFLGETIHSLLYQVINQEPPRLTSLNPSIPPEVEKVVARGMAKAKGDRFPTINAFSRELVAAATGSSVSPSVATAPSEAAISTGRVRQRTPAPAPVPAAQSAEPQPTTLSRTASELVTTPLSKLRAGLKSKWTAVAGAAVAVALIVAVVYPKHRPNQVDTALTPASSGGDAPATAAHAPIIAPIATPTPPTPPVVAVPTPPPLPMAPPPPQSPSATVATDPTPPANEGSKTKRSRTKTPPAMSPKTPVVEPARKTPPARPAARHGSIIEEL
jgi:serine/threonine-protein kinase